MKSSLEELDNIISFLQRSEQLKNTLRSGHTSEGRQESVAEHTWRLCLLAILLEKDYPLLSFSKLIKMLLIHDLGEIINGDIPAIYQDPEVNKDIEERRDFQLLISDLPDELKRELSELWDEYGEAKSPEAKLAKALDKLETILQHNQGKNPADFDYEFNLGYGSKYTNLDETIRYIRKKVDEDTRNNIKSQNTKSSF